LTKKKDAEEELRNHFLSKKKSLAQEFKKQIQAHKKQVIECQNGNKTCTESDLPQLTHIQQRTLKPVEIGYIVVIPTTLILLLLCIGLYYKRQQSAVTDIKTNEIRVAIEDRKIVNSQAISKREDQLAIIIETQ